MHNGQNHAERRVKKPPSIVFERRADIQSPSLIQTLLVSKKILHTKCCPLLDISSCPYVPLLSFYFSCHRLDWNKWQETEAKANVSSYMVCSLSTFCVIWCLECAHESARWSCASQRNAVKILETHLFVVLEQIVEYIPACGASKENETFSKWCTVVFRRRTIRARAVQSICVSIHSGAPKSWVVFVASWLFLTAWNLR